MRRVMIIGQPGSGKSTLARQMGEITFLPVVHIDHIHWKSGWIERPQEEKSRLCEDVHARDAWIFEGGYSATWSSRMQRADTLIWIDLPLPLRAWRVFRRTALSYGRTRPDLPDGCPEYFSAEFWHYIWRTRHTARAGCANLFASCPETKDRHHLQSPRAVQNYLSHLTEALSVGHLGIPHR
ncbi:adenylate kinase family enzyme [Litoreibacter ponti]|uniref:Adenylate kinase family enzyme n=1 Tax=Litoreibacter ponti TaxID=1510457 RepID=A0A2T6BDI4_9RHOB|nr:AAA family ATPase [Litoreibacter ponti]PTX54137.1 adenylate kinase family enzyme [Litoreibacter ponti]